MKVNEIAPCINVYQDFIESNLFMNCVDEEYLKEWGEINWRKSSVGRGSVGNYRTSAEADITNLIDSGTHMANLFKPISNKIINELLDDYKKEFLVHTNQYEGWRLLRYSGGGEYHAHYDHSPDNSRIISIVAFLESPESGGELEFPYFGVNISPTVNTVVIFPSNFPYTHIAHPVDSGTKCSLVTWVQ